MQIGVAIFEDHRSSGGGGVLHIPQPAENPIELGPSITALVARARAPDGADVAATIAELDRRLADPEIGDPFRLWGLARQLDCYLVARDAGDRKGEGRGRRRGWASFLTAFNAFCRRVEPDLPVCPQAVRDDDLRALRDYSTATTRKRHFYASLVLFLWNALEVEPERAAQMREWLPASEQEMIAQIVASLFDENARDAAPAPVEEPANVEPELPAIRMGFAYRDDHREAFDKFFAAFAAERDGCAHFVGYRNARRHPENLVKSFLAIRPPTAERDWHTFAHFYMAPARGEQNRLSTGFVLPLEHGVYLVGGQYPQVGVEKRHDYFKTLEVIAWSWSDLEVPEPVLEGLVLSSNYDFSHVLARSVFRATSVCHSQRFSKPLDLVPRESLVEDITSDLEDEKAAGFGWMRAAPTKLAAQILSMTNNLPGHWEVPANFRPESGARRTRPLTKAGIQEELDDVFGTLTDARYKSEDGAVFRFWNDIRFGALDRSR